MATTKIECVHILNLWIGINRAKTWQVRSSVVLQHDVVEARRLIITLGGERWAQSTKDLASALDKNPDWATSSQREGARQRLDDEAFSRRYKHLDEGLVGGGR